MEHREHHAEVWQEQVIIPTYGIGAPDRNPMFLEKRVYQGSSGKVYPLPVVDKILDEKEDRAYQAVFLENDYIRVMVLPELGGRIQRAYDKTNGYDFVYYNEVIKPALVGLTGPWISGGIEFNWPQHHRPTTFAPVDWRIEQNGDGSASVEMSEVDQMYGSKGKMRFTVYPDKAYIEIRGQLYNRTPFPQTFLWWANPAVSVNDDTQSVFPPDVTAVYDHGKRDVSSFPIATGVYYKHDYGAGVDISRYKNIPVPTSYMCAHSDYDFVGGYDYGVQAGILHVADHHIGPGKKQWTWGCGDFGRAWDRNLTDENGPYIELMTGMFCDNQPDFTWLKPFEEKVFTQYFMPYKKAGYVKNATVECAVNLETSEGRAHIVVYATSPFRDARVELKENGRVIYQKICTLSPVDVLEDSAEWSGGKVLDLSVYEADGRLIVSYVPLEKGIEPIPDPAEPARQPEEIMTNEELYLTGLHIEQYRHATYLPDPYYLEAMKRDPGDIRCNNAYGSLLLRRGLFEESERYFRKAIERMTKRNPNPYDSEPYVNLGLCLMARTNADRARMADLRHDPLIYAGHDFEAYDAFYKAAWSAAQQEIAFYYLAALDARRGAYADALVHIERAIVRNSRNLKARALKGLLLDALGREEEAAAWYAEDLKVDAFDYVSRLESGDREGALALMGSRASSYIECALDYAEAGFYAKAVKILEDCPSPGPMVYYHLAWNAYLSGNADKARKALRAAAAADPTCCFPNRLEDIVVLEFAMKADPSDARAPYYLGCLWYDRRQYEAAIECWEKSVSLDDTYATPWRNLSLAYYNKRGNREKALECMEKAFSLDPSDARVLLELDQLKRKLGFPVSKRLAFLDAHRETAFKRDDLYIEYCTLLNLLGRHEEALELIMARRFQPWEGGEGKVTSQYAIALTQMGIRALEAGDAGKAKALFERALVFPHNLGEGKLEGAKDNDLYYWLGMAERVLGNEDAALAHLERAAAGDEEPAGMMYYNDQPADMILYEGLANRALGREDRASGRFHKLISYGEKHIFDTVRIDYFAVSLPDLQLFDEDLTLRNKMHCEYLIALGSYGLGDYERARLHFRLVLSKDCAYQGAIDHLGLLPDA